MSEFERDFHSSEPDDEWSIIESGEPIQPFLPKYPRRTEGPLIIPSVTPVIWSSPFTVLGVGRFQIGLKELLRKPSRKNSSEFRISSMPVIPVPVLKLEDAAYADERCEFIVEHEDMFGRIIPRRTEDPQILIFDTYFMADKKVPHIPLDNEDKITNSIYILGHTVF